ncbi:YpmS family protein [Streptococcus suis]|uniref:YpmS family protein n=1 Tax=Streptococcus suivaginalis TaxID=3028082 RepID=A0AA96VG66_9STRE|nr:YpmS family protein [Streptococcus sp. 29896]MCK4027869.1 YpmS family protein [Streptococcus suis]WNY47588.1 YpmS family protein [Streptococcus sp. 29896]HEL2058386.1 YpmS family protein [Streptococcus suis]
MQAKSNGKINVWKWACLLLLAFQLAFALVIWKRVTTVREEIASQIVSSQTGEKVGQFSTSKEELNQLMNSYLEEYQTEDFSYQVYLNSQFLLFEGSYQFLGSSIPLSIYFIPSKLENGDILLKVSEISAGTLPLPTKEILTYIDKNYKLPTFIQIDKDQSQLVIALNQLENDLGLFARVNTIDLYNDQILLDLYRKS